MQLAVVWKELAIKKTNTALFQWFLHFSIQKQEWVSLLIIVILKLIKMPKMNSSEKMDPDFKIVEKKYSYRRWTGQEQHLYILYLSSTLQSKNQYPRPKRVPDFFKKMSNFIKTKSNAQCRTHHVKMRNHYGDDLKIIDCLKSRLTEKGIAMGSASLENSSFEKKEEDSPTPTPSKQISLEEYDLEKSGEEVSFFSLFVPPQPDYWQKMILPIEL